jgi:hypothetical protein
VYDWTEWYQDTIFTKWVIINNEDEAWWVKSNISLPITSAFTYSAIIDIDWTDDGTYFYVFKADLWTQTLAYSLMMDNYSQDQFWLFEIDDHYNQNEWDINKRPKKWDRIFIAITWDKNKNWWKSIVYFKNLTTWIYYTYSQTTSCTSDLSVDWKWIVWINSTYTDRQKIVFDQVRIFNRALTESEVQKLYNEH